MGKFTASSLLLDYVKRGENQVWVGENSPYNMVSLDLLHSSNYRASSSHHHRYDIVWFYESPLDSVGKLGWKVLLDELIRLLTEKGHLIIKIRENNTPSLFLLKKFLGRHLGIETEIEYEARDENFVWTVVFQITRLNIEKYSAEDWTFAILTTGNKVENVLAFLQTIREYEPVHGGSEIIVVGPRNDLYDAFHVRYIDTTPFRDDRYAEICRKKNAVIDAACRTNLMIVHDRFKLGKDFFVGFSKFGYDFDFVTVSQSLEDGRPFPCYAATKDYMRLSGQIWVKEYRHLYDTSYINGGLIILKTHTAREIRFNDLLMWAQMEDVELSRVCMERGIVPRVNFVSEAVILDLREDYLHSWVSEEKSKLDPEGPHALPKIAMFTSLQARVAQKIVHCVPRFLKRNRVYEKLKRTFLSRHK